MKTSLFLILAGLSVPLHAEVREFKNTKGQVIRAEPVLVRGPNILLKLENKQQVPVPVKSLSAEDQAWITDWLAWDAKATDYNFDVRSKEATGEALKQKFYYYRYEAAPKGYDLQITNRSQTTIGGVKVAYRVFMEDRVMMEGSTFLKVQYHSDLMELPVMKYNLSHGVATKKLKCEKLVPMDNYTGYNGKVTRDRLRGVWVRFYRHGEMVQEWKAQGVPKCEWPESAAEQAQLAQDKEAATAGAAEAARKAAAAKEPPKTTPEPAPEPTPAPAPAAPKKEVPKSEPADDEMPAELKIFELDD